VNKTADRPPILRFMAMFMGLLIAATGLAALTPAPELPPEPATATRGPHAPEDRGAVADRPQQLNPANP
jgi:hypothetical protein